MEVGEWFYFQIKKEKKGKKHTEPIINPNRFVDKHLATYILVIFWHLFLMPDKYSVIVGFFIQAFGITGTECSHSTMNC